MALTITKKADFSIPVEVDSIRMENVVTQSLDEIKATPIQYGKLTPSLGEFFDVSGSAADDKQIVWHGDCSRVKLIGCKLAEGSIRIEGDAGMHLGAEMTGGEITVTGNTGDWLGAEMHGGRITVDGNTGHLVGAVYRGGHRGMTGGEILIHGNAGNELGHSMRRGLIAVGGRSGDIPGVNLIAGSILLFGESGIRPGAGMKRGSIVYFDGANAPAALPTFRKAGRFQPTFLRFYLLELKARGFNVADELIDAEYDRYCGDFLELGKGEVLVRVAA